MKVLFLQFSRILHGLGLICLLTSCSTNPLIVESKKPPKPEAFLGITLSPVKTSNKMVISGIVAGPFALAMQNLNINTLEDAILMSIQDQVITQQNWQQVIDSLIPGESITVQMQHSSETVLLNMDVVVGDKNVWQGPINKTGITPKKILFLNESAQFSAIKTLILEQSYVHQQQDEVAALHKLFNAWQMKHNGFHSLSRVNFPFQQPMQLLELEKSITQQFVHSESQTLIAWLADNLDLKPIESKKCNQKIDNQYLIHALKQSKRYLSDALKHLDQAQQLAIKYDLYYLLSEYAHARSIINHAEPSRSLNAMNTSMLIDYSSLLSATNVFSCLLNNNDLNISTSKTNSLPTELRQAVTGEIQQAIKIDNDWFIIGGEGTNRYDMSIIAMVYDPDGDDEYYSSQHIPGQVKLVIDKQGNDIYQTDNGGPSSAWLGISILIDYQGDDIYKGDLAANGVGMMGMGLLIDHQGKDSYQGNWFSNGSAFYGAGLIIDLGQENDTYQSYAFSQALGGPRGIGLIYDFKGNERYISTGRLTSVYGVKDEFASFSQGFGFGIRHYDSGGMGILFDQAGDDHYEGGEFSQGGAYYWGLGILHDVRGNDVYKANRYAQGFGVHQATGIFIDEQGNDKYLATTAACQGAAWDVALGLMVDMQGDDHYQGEHLCQGAAAMQAQAWLIDLDGKDSYEATTKTSQGSSGANTYHFDKDKPVYSWSLLLDAGGETDTYSSGLLNNSTSANADYDLQALEKSRAHGLFIDT